MHRRVMFGAALIAGVSALVWLDVASATAWGSGTLIAAALLLAIRELWQLLGTLGDTPGRNSAMGLALALVLLPFVLPQATAAGLDLLVFWGYLVAFWSRQLVYEPGRDRAVALALHGFGALYLLLPGIFILRLRCEPHGLAWLLYAVALAKGADMAAYFTGRFLGRRKLIPWISPGKTWAGAAGAVLGAAVVTLAFERLAPAGAGLPWAVVVPLTILAAAAGMCGDLVESLLKRSARRKDSAALVPEFGGVLDIIDSILFVGPLVYAAVQLAPMAAGI